MAGSGETSAIVVKEEVANGAREVGSSCNEA